MDPDELDIANRFRAALEIAGRTGDWTGVYPCLADDIEWITPMRTLTGIDEVENDLIWGSPPDHLDVEFDVGEWTDLGEGRAGVRVHQVYRVKNTGDFAYERDLQIEIAIREAKIGRYEIRSVG